MSDDGNLRPLFRAHIPHFFWTSIESGLTAAGISDSNYVARGGIEGWIEYKQTTGHAVTLKPEQIAWIERRVRCGVRAWIGVRRWHAGGPRRGAACDELWLVPGRLARAARLGGLRDPEVAAAAHKWAGGPARWDWCEVARLLCNPAQAKGTPRGP